MLEQPSIETLYVGHTMAMLALRDLSRDLAAYLAGVERVDGSPSEEGEACVRRLLERLAERHLDTDVTDLPPGSFDADMAKAIALDTIGEQVRFITESAL
jgi:hypothetical protein